VGAVGNCKLEGDYLLLIQREEFAWTAVSRKIFGF